MELYVRTAYAIAVPAATREALKGKTMFIWRGAGVVVIVVVFMTSLCANLLTIAAFGKGYWETHSWPIGCVFFVAGGIIWLTGMVLARAPTRILVDEKTGERGELTNAHDFFFIPLKWWGPISAAIGGYILLSGTIPG
jgi:hypothetical protein